MTSKEALEMLKRCGTNTEEPYESKIIEALEKLVERDTPMKPIVNVDLDGYTKYNCPKCVCTLNIPIREINGCPKCLQRIDWGE